MDDAGLQLTVFDEVRDTSVRAPLARTRVWLRAECDYLKNIAVFRYSTDGQTFTAIGEPHVMAYGLITFQGVRNSLFAYNTRGGEGGAADFDAIEVQEEQKPAIPLGKRIELSSAGATAAMALDEARTFTVIDRGLGRVAFESDGRYVSVDQDHAVALRRGAPGDAETFQWIETFDGDLILMSLTTKRYLRVDTAGRMLADSPGPRPDGQDGVRLRWRPN